ncbi:MAG: hypothetical protein IT330_17030 [Anaerolineae bacterium]|nr:hypothetical protein [Anaerolineae bacterium]
MFSVKQTRRWFLKMAGAALAALGLHGQRAGTLAGAPAALTTLYFLDPEWGQGAPACSGDPHQGSRDCHACTACHQHALHKRFASADAANRLRAHTRCKCLVRSAEITAREYLSLFGSPSGANHRDEYDDRRDIPYSLKRLYLPVG